MCGRVHSGHNVGLPSTERHPGVIKSVTVNSGRDRPNPNIRTRRIRGLRCHVLFDDGSCQTLESKYIQHENVFIQR